MSTELLNLLEKVKGNSLIGWSIQCALHNSRQEELLNTLQEMAEHNPGIIIEVIGKEALTLLKQEVADLHPAANNSNPVLKPVHNKNL